MVPEPEYPSQPNQPQQSPEPQPQSEPEQQEVAPPPEPEPVEEQPEPAPRIPNPGEGPYQVPYRVVVVRPVGFFSMLFGFPRERYVSYHMFMGGPMPYRQPCGPNFYGGSHRQNFHQIHPNNCQPNRMNIHRANPVRAGPVRYSNMHQNIRSSPMRSAPVRRK